LCRQPVVRTERRQNRPNETSDGVSLFSVSRRSMNDSQPEYCRMVEGRAMSRTKTSRAGSHHCTRARPDLRRPFLVDVHPLLTAEERERFDEAAGKLAFKKVFNDFIGRIPGKAWATTPELLKKHGLT
jgi:hypothetical protein